MLEILAMNLEGLGKDLIKTKLQSIITDLVNDRDIEVKIDAM